MKNKFLFLILLSLIPLANATPDAQMKIRIKASDFADCSLIEYSILGGHISDHTDLPKTIYRSQTAAFSMRPTGKHLAEISLTYACGDNMTISLLTTQKYWQGYYSSGKILKAKGMQASIKIASGKSVRPDRVYWTFKEGCPCS